MGILFRRARWGAAHMGPEDGLLKGKGIGWKRVL